MITDAKSATSVAIDTAVPPISADELMKTMQAEMQKCLDRQAWEAMLVAPFPAIQYINVHLVIGPDRCEPKSKCHCDWIKKVSEGYSCISCDDQILTK